MNRHSQRGVALVITLVMLAIVTFMAVVFLATSRRERASVSVSASQTDAKFMADSALARAQADIASRILSTTNPFNYDLIVSTNYYNPLGFQPDVTGNPLNVNFYEQRNRQPLAADHRVQNLANLQYDPRPPVWIQTNANGDSEFRFYLDLNQNGRFEPNGLAPVISDTGTFYDTNGNPTSLTPPGNVLSNFFVGDPEWIGVLERPDRPHSESNRFIGRYAFIALPTGKSLDLNFIHNDSKRPRELMGNGDAFFRNHGFGSWELNLAGFLRDLNTNVWSYTSYRTIDRNSSSGGAFYDALSILRYRYDRDEAAERTPRILFGPASKFWTDGFAMDGLDNYGDGPLLLGRGRLNLDAPPPSADQDADAPWPGASNDKTFLDVQELFSFSGSPEADSLKQRVKLMTITNLVNRAREPGTYNRYSYYRLMAQMGVDSLPADTFEAFDDNFRKVRVPKMHLNYRDLNNDRQHEREYQTNFVSWTPLPVGAALPSQDASNARLFFLEAASRLLRASMETNYSALGSGFRLHYSLGSRFEPNQPVPLPSPVRKDFSLTNIQVFHAYNDEILRNTLSQPLTPLMARMEANFEYTAAVHRCLQLAVNIYDSTTRRLQGAGTTNAVDFPTVLRPIFLKTDTSVIITDYEEVISDLALLNLTNNWFTPRQIYDPANDFPKNTPLRNVNVYGIPWVIGVKKGFPNFNEYAMEAEVSLSRKLELRRPAVGVRPTETNQLYGLGFRMVPGFEGWNSYTNDFRRSFEVKFHNQYQVDLYDRRADGNLRPVFPRMLMAVSTNIATNVWPGNAPIFGRMESFVSAVFTNVVRPFGAYYTRTQPAAGRHFEASFDVPDLTVVMTNRLQYALVDASTRRILDFVNLDQMVMSNNVSDLLNLPINRSGALSGSSMTGNNPAGGGGAVDVFNRGRIVPNDNTSPTIGVTNQLGISAGAVDVSEATWRRYSAVPMNDKVLGREGFAAFLNGTDRSQGLARETPFNPDIVVTTNMLLQVNDPLVHYTLEDLSVAQLRRLRPSLAARLNPDDALPVNAIYQPWGGNPNNPSDAHPEEDYHVLFKDPLIRRSDDWDFPTNKLPNIGWLGRVHRGTPWQTMYLKSFIELNATDRPQLWYQFANSPNPWFRWSGSAGTHPTNDWRLLDVFTVAPNANAVRGLLSVNQTNQAAWSAALSGVWITTNTTPRVELEGARNRSVARVNDVVISPASPQLREIVGGIVQTRLHNTNLFRIAPSFQSMGEILSTPELTLRSPFLNFIRDPQNVDITNNVFRLIQDDPMRKWGISDNDYERIPQQIMSLLKADEPRFVVYAFGQSLRPAERSVVTASGVFNICTNYQITGEVFSKAVMRVQDVPPPPNATNATQLLGYPKSKVVVESFNLLPPE